MATSVTSGSSCLPLALVSTLLGWEPASDMVSWMDFEGVWEGSSGRDHEESFLLGATDGCV